MRKESPGAEHERKSTRLSQLRPRSQRTKRQPEKSTSVNVQLERFTRSNVQLRKATFSKTVPSATTSASSRPVNAVLARRASGVVSAARSSS